VSLAHAILGMLDEAPQTGYDLKTRCFDKSIAHFWPADQAQIYRTLDKMREEGWVESEVEHQKERPDRKVYHLRPAGKKELLRWLADEEIPLPAIREPFLVQLFFADHLSDEEARAKLVAQRALHEARLARYEAVPLPERGTKGLPREHQFGRMTLDMGLAYERAMLAWLDGCIEHLDGKGRHARRAHR
jgi:DNA-binding PadR family transcriptional regulator